VKVRIDSSPTSGNTAWNATLTASVAAFPALLAVIALVVLTAALLGQHPLWSEPTLNLAEAAALKDRGTIQRLLWDGADPNARSRVRPGIIHDDEVLATPLEASVATRTADTMKLLLAQGARMDATTRTVIVCLAVQEGAREILELLDSDSDDDPECGDVARPWSRD
jgi:hypothetical protein